MGPLEELEHLKSVNMPKSVWAMFTSTKKFVAIFSEHRARDQRATKLAMDLPGLGLRPHYSTPAGIEFAAREAVASVRGAVHRTFAVSTLTLVLALLAAYLLEAVRFDLPFHMGKALQVAGGFFAVWGTLLAIKGPASSLSGASIPERVHAATYTALLGVGAGLAMVGTLVSP